MRGFLLSIAILTLVFQSQVSSAFAQEAPSLQVNHIAGGLEKIVEKLTLFVKFNKSDKLDYQEYLLEKRLAELKFAVENDIDLVEETASRYSTYAGSLTNFIVSNEIENEKKRILETFDKHSSIISSLRDKFGFESGWWLAIQHDVNTIEILREKIVSPQIP